MNRADLRKKISERLELLHEASMLSISSTTRIADKFEESDKQGSSNLRYIAKGQQQSHTLIDAAVYDVLEMLKSQ